MATKEWLVPLALAAIAFAGLLALPLPDPHDAPTDRHIEPFAGHGGPGPHVVLSHEPHPLGVEQDPCGGCFVQSPIDWATPHVGLRPSWEPPGEEHCDFGCRLPLPALGADGHNATRATVHVFDADGELVFSNGNASEQRRLTRTYAPEQLPTGVWYLGANATAPPGTSRLPPAAAAFLDSYRDQMQGMRVGDVLTVETDALAGLYGPLWVTLRIDGLVRAP